MPWPDTCPRARHLAGLSGSAARRPALMRRLVTTSEGLPRVSRLESTKMLIPPGASTVQGQLFSLLPFLEKGATRLDPTATVATNAVVPLTIPTPDGSGQVVEPAVEYIPAGWNGHKYWALVTGYTGGNPVTENPSSYYSDDGQTFTPVPSAAFPLIPTPADGTNDDPELVLGPDNQLHGFYESVLSGTTTTVSWIASQDGVNWTPPQVLFSNQNSVEAVGSAVFDWDGPNNQWVCYYTDQANYYKDPKIIDVYPLKRRTCPGTSPGGPWSAPTVCSVNNTPAGKSIFELHIARRGDQMHMVATFTTIGSGGSNVALHFGVSNDGGLTWTFNPTPLLSASASGWDNGLMYRGDIVPLDDGGTGLYGLWYSAMSSAYVWQMGYTEITALVNLGNAADKSSTATQTFIGTGGLDVQQISWHNGASTMSFGSVGPSLDTGSVLMMNQVCCVTGVDLKVSDGTNLNISTIGDGLKIAEGANAKQGIATLVAGTVTVACTTVTANSRILLTAQDNGTTGALRVSARTAGVGFTIASSNVADGGVVAYEIFEPGG